MKILVLCLVVLSVGSALYINFCPCGPVPGAWLLGDAARESVDDWSFANDRTRAPLCQLQINTWRPHSVNANCMADAGQLYVSCSNCAGKRWSNSALEHPDGLIRIGATVYPVTYLRVQDAQELDRAWAARLRKVQGSAAPRPDHWWSFRLTSR